MPQNLNLRLLARPARIERATPRLGVHLDDFFRVLHKALQCRKTRLDTGFSGNPVSFRNCAVSPDIAPFFGVLLAVY
jgi:hypothetical protein